MHSQCIDQYVDRIGPSICFTEWYFLWDLYSRKWWCHPSALHIEEPYWSHHHSFYKLFLIFILQETSAQCYFKFLLFLIFILQKTSAQWYFYFWDASIYYTLIIQILPKALWCVIIFTPAIAHVVQFRSSWYHGTHDF